MLFSLYLSELHLLLYILHSNIFIHQNTYVNPDKPLPIRCNQTHTVPIISHKINGK